jgi:ketol-acid reductoisomerase
VVGNLRDASYETAIAHGFSTYSVAEAVSMASIHFLLLPDETMPKIFDQDILPNLHAGDAIVVASGYNVMYGFLKYPSNVDLLMIAPRMIGTGVRNGYVSGKGFPSLVSVEQDFTGEALQRLLTLAHGVGTLRGGAVDSSCYEETLCDLFNEHFGYIYALKRAYEMLLEAGASPEAAMLEFWASGEEMELARVHMTHGLFYQLELHSETSQYGQEVTAILSDDDEKRERDRLRSIIERIKDGSFARDWQEEQNSGCVKWKKIHRENQRSDLSIAEENLLRRLGVLERE